MEHCEKCSSTIVLSVEEFCLFPDCKCHQIVDEYAGFSQADRDEEEAFIREEQTDL